MNLIKIPFFKKKLLKGLFESINQNRVLKFFEFQNLRFQICESWKVKVNSKGVWSNLMRKKIDKKAMFKLENVLILRLKMENIYVLNYQSS